MGWVSVAFCALSAAIPKTLAMGSWSAVMGKSAKWESWWTKAVRGRCLGNAEKPAGK